MAQRKVFKILFQSQGKLYEIYAKAVSHGTLFGFVEVEELLFGERTQVVVDPSEEELKNEFRGVRRTFLPMHSIVRIDEVAKEGVARISAGAKGEGVLTPFPTPVPPSTRGSKS